MKQVLYNLALIDSMNFCKEHKIDCSGTHLYKYPRRFVYALLRDSDNRAVITTTFYKMSVPTHFIHDNK